MYRGYHETWYFIMKSKPSIENLSFLLLMLSIFVFTMFTIWYILFIDDLDSRELEAEGKKIVIEVKSNEQGRFFKIIEVKILNEKYWMLVL